MIILGFENCRQPARHIGVMRGPAGIGADRLEQRGPAV
jgi:hypothetical protein